MSSFGKITKIAPVMFVFKEISSCEVNDCLLKEILSLNLRKRNFYLK